jgi:hypothetical protein
MASHGRVGLPPTWRTSCAGAQRDDAGRPNGGLYLAQFIIARLPSDIPAHYFSFSFGLGK